MFRSLKKRQRPSRSRRPARSVRGLALESLEGRVVPAVSATFLPAAGQLTVFGDGLDNLGRNIGQSHEPTDVEVTEAASNLES